MKQQLLVCFLVAGSALANRGNPQALLVDSPPWGAISIRLERIAQGSDTISFGLPLRLGAVSDTASVRVTVGTGTVAATIKPLLYHHDQNGDPTSLRAVVVQLPASLMTGPTLTLDVTLNAAGPPPPTTIRPFASLSVAWPETAPCTHVPVC